MWQRASWETIGIEAEGHALTVAEMHHPAAHLQLDPAAECAPTIAWALRFFHELRDGVSLCVETSGTTGRPKRVCHSLDTVAANAEAVWAALGLRDEGERWLCPLPLNHIGGRMVLARCWYMNGTPVLGGLDRLDDVTVASLVPTQLYRLLESGRPAPAAKILLGGSGASRELLERARDAGWDVRQSYGLTEACSTVTIADADDLDTSGQPIGWLRLTLALDGEILVHGVDTYADGAIATGDLGALTDDGRLIVTGRKDELLVTGGENVMPAEVEAVLTSFWAVKEAAVVGRPDREWGTRLAALVVLDGTLVEPGRDQIIIEMLRYHCREHLPGFKVPKEFERVEALPRTASGKLLRRELR